MISQTYIKECLRYDPETGDFFWIERPREHFDSDRIFNIYKSQICGKKAGSLHRSSKSKTYMRIKIDKKKYYAHRIAFIYMKGYHPEEVDHIDGNGINNSWENIREASRIENCKNTKLSIRNTSGNVGVFFDKDKWRAFIYDDRKIIYLGSFFNKEDAVKARKDAEKKYNYHPLHGSKPCQKER